MKKILLIGTGGTIASKEMGDGLTPELAAKEIVSYVPEVQNLCEIEVLQLCNIDSTNMHPKIWTELAKAVQKNFDRYDGFVVLHGTDTMAYTSAALSYMIQHSRKPIVVTGSQQPIDREGTDARVNLRDSILYAMDEYSENVVLVFDGNVISGTRAKKMQARSFNAFQSVNFPVLARVQDGRIIRYLPYIPEREPVRFYTEISDSVCVFKLIPGTRPELLSYLFANYDCVVMESFGVGGIPDALLDTVYQAMQKWKEAGKFLVMATQVMNEGSNMEIYRVGQKVKKDFQLIEAYDMTLEAVVTKLMVLLKRYGSSYEELQRAFYSEVNHDILCAFLAEKFL